MALSNKWGALVLTTGNKSELGGRLLHALRRYVRRPGRDQRRAQDAGLLALARRQPAAPRRHSGKRLRRSRPRPSCGPIRRTPIRCPPYDVLDRILRAYVEDYQAPPHRGRVQPPPSTLVRISSTKWTATNTRRQQAAPGLKVTTKAFGIGRRFPIAQKYAGVMATGRRSRSCRST